METNTEIIYISQTDGKIKEFTVSERVIDVEAMKVELSSLLEIKKQSEPSEAEKIAFANEFHPYYQLTSDLDVKIMTLNESIINLQNLD